MTVALADARAGESGVPTCSDPAELKGHFDSRAPGLFIKFKHGIDPNAAAVRLAEKYHFKIASRYSWGAIYSLDIDLGLLPQVQCEPEVEYLEFNAVATAS